MIFSGLYTSPTHNESLCAEENFLDRAWVTQGRSEVSDPTPYPITGEYTGSIPDTEGLCAKLYSDCNNPEIMFYTIFNCFKHSEVYEGKITTLIRSFFDPRGRPTVTAGSVHYFRPWCLYFRLSPLFKIVQKKLINNSDRFKWTVGLA